MLQNRINPLNKENLTSIFSHLPEGEVQRLRIPTKEELGWDLPLRLCRIGDVQEKIQLFYFFDAQNFFDPSEASHGMSWLVRESLRKLHQSAILVGFESPAGDERLYAYSPFMPEEGSFPLPAAGKEVYGLKLLEILVKQILPPVEETLRTIYTNRPLERTLAGSSLGGVMTLTAGALYPSLFTHLLAMSTAGHYFTSNLLRDSANYQTSQRLYFDVGHHELDSEREYLEFNRMFLSHLDKIAPEQLWYYEDAEGRHNEDHWAKRLPQALQFLWRI